MPTKRQEMTFLNTLITLSSQTNRYIIEMKQVVELFKERKIPTVATARKITDLLGSKTRRRISKDWNDSKNTKLQKYLLED